MIKRTIKYNCPQQLPAEACSSVGGPRNGSYEAPIVYINPDNTNQTLPMVANVKDVSTLEIKKILKTIIEEEDKHKPLPDD